MTKPSTIRVLGAIAILGWLACAWWSVVQSASDQVDASNVVNVLAYLIIGFALSTPFLVAVGRSLVERD